MSTYRDDLFEVHNFDPGDIVQVSKNMAGMTKGEVGMVTDVNYEQGIVEIRLSSNLRYYNMLPDWLEHVTI